MLVEHQDHSRIFLLNHRLEIRRSACVDLRSFAEMPISVFFSKELIHIKRQLKEFDLVLDLYDRSHFIKQQRYRLTVKLETCRVVKFIELPINNFNVGVKAAERFFNWSGDVARCRFLRDCNSAKKYQGGNCYYFFHGN